MEKKSRTVLLLAVGFVVGQLNPVGWAVLKIVEARAPAIKERALGKPSPFSAIPRREWLAESERAFVVPNRTAPAAPVHLLVVPKQEFPTLLETPDEVLGEMLGLVKQVARSQGVAEEGFRVVVNTNPLGGQHVYHLHIHLLGGRQMGWPILRSLWGHLTRGG